MRLALLTLAALAAPALSQTPDGKPTRVPAGSFAVIELKLDKGDKVLFRATPAPAKVVDKGDGSLYFNALVGTKTSVLASKINFDAKTFDQTTYEFEFVAADAKPTPGPAPKPDAPPAPVVPPDPLAVAIRAAYLADPDPEKATRLAERVELYAQAARLAASTDLATVAEVLGKVKEAGASLSGDALLGVRKLASAELAALFPGDSPLDADLRAKLAAAFARVGAALRAAAQ